MQSQEHPRTVLPLSSLPSLLFFVRKGLGSRHFLDDPPALEAAPSVVVLYMMPNRPR